MYGVGRFVGIDEFDFVGEDVVVDEDAVGDVVALEGDEILNL